MLKKNVKGHQTTSKIRDSKEAMKVHKNRVIYIRKKLQKLK